MAGITQSQKQALTDNLQLEITERARKLRAQYALQAQGLRTRLEMRVNRIPQALRKRNIQEVLDEHASKSRPAPPPPMPVASKAHQSHTAQQAQTAPAQKTQPSKKRKSDEISTGDDKENIPSNPASELANPKKRTKTTGAVANSKATRTASRKAGPARVLSPKSHNSRTLPQSPIKPSTLSPEKALPAQPQLSAQPAPAKRSTRAPSRQTKRAGAATDGTEGRTSEASNSSAGTTIITKSGKRKQPPAPKKTTTAKAAPTGKKPAAVKQDVPGRTLRKRNP
ncbi:hypothetical protein M409DRAFT_52335 [Zasmidium cellare ATCC 36951]|uniref:Borealin N-terminal domain-containing protein n=1 Tax=Zasmidium cellare ATCC 36951 TaxID=1080233 RepID=A0A6A6CRQ9_ZASCE|nr:uncharacterized protein M409DRAFT_52335 [Zasmidium cellare ATCC 36951]KAF2169844.1 hypothetical protein M409DRAFT_52335 [Zasmidium cellare ATCC 36951]